MKTCELCMHRTVCGITRSENQQACANFRTDGDAYRTLRLIYAELYASAKKNRERAETQSRFGDAATASELRRISEIQNSTASRVRFWCRKIDFDPSASG